MKIIEFRAENFKRLKVVEITPDGTLQVVAGRNAQGKTSVLDAIWLALGGGPAAKNTSRPIRDGETTAEVHLDLGDIVVTRTWTDAGTNLKVTSAEGSRFKSPQAMLDGLVGRLSFDPLAFTQQDDKTQLATLLELVDLPFDLDDLAAQRADAYERRTEVNRRAKQLEAQAKGFPRPPKGLPAEEQSAAELLAELRAKQDAQRADAEVGAQAKAAVGRWQRLQQDLADLEAQVAEAAVEANRLTQQVLTLPEPEDLSAYEERLASIDEVNAAVRSARQRAEAQAAATAAAEESQGLTDYIAGLDEKKAAAIRDADMPVDGLGFDDDGVTFNGVPFRQCSAAERLRVSMAIAMADNPQLRVIRITDGSLLDSDNLALIEQMAADRDFQVWVERVDESGAVGVVIEDGEVAS